MEIKTRTEIMYKWQAAKDAGNEAQVAMYETLAESQQDMDITKRQLIFATRDAIKRLCDLQKAIENDASGVNSLGTLQGLGSEIDRMTGQLAVQRKHLIAVQRIVGAAEKG